MHSRAGRGEPADEGGLLADGADRRFSKIVDLSGQEACDPAGKEQGQIARRSVGVWAGQAMRRDMDKRRSRVAPAQSIGVMSRVRRHCGRPSQTIISAAARLRGTESPLARSLPWFRYSASGVKSSRSMQVTPAPTSASSRQQTAAATPRPSWTTLNPVNKFIGGTFQSNGRGIGLVIAPADPKNRPLFDNRRAHAGSNPRVRRNRSYV